MGKFLEAAQKLRTTMDAAGAMLTDEQALQVTALFPVWNPSATYAVGDRVRYDGKLYRCITAHAAQENWTPAAAPSLWAKVLTDPSGGVLPWVQPDSTNPYSKGDRVTHNGKTWISDVDGNVWEPGVYGWSQESA